MANLTYPDVVADATNGTTGTQIAEAFNEIKTVVNNDTMPPAPDDSSQYLATGTSWVPFTTPESGGYNASLKTNTACLYSHTPHLDHFFPLKGEPDKVRGSNPAIWCKEVNGILSFGGSSPTASLSLSHTSNVATSIDQLYALARNGGFPAYTAVMIVDVDTSLIDNNNRTASFGYGGSNPGLALKSTFQGVELSLTIGFASGTIFERTVIASDPLSYLNEGLNTIYATFEVLNSTDVRITLSGEKGEHLNKVVTISDTGQPLATTAFTGINNVDDAFRMVSGTLFKGILAPEQVQAHKNALLNQIGVV